MSRLDFVTIAIVAVCVLALGLLIFRVVNLTGEGDSEPIAEGEDPYDEYFEDTPTSSDEETYDPASTADESATNEADEYDEDAGIAEGASATTEDETIADEELDNEEAVPESYSPATLGDNVGQYLLIAGNFTSKANAESHAEKLRGLGYSNTTVEPFDRGTINVVLVDRYEDLSRARTAARELEDNHGIAAYVQQKKPVVNKE